MVSSLDILPTFLSLAGIPKPTDREFDGTDITNVLLAKTSKTPNWRKNKFYHFGTVRSMVKWVRVCMQVGP
eukprot:UN08872